MKGGWLRITSTHTFSPSSKRHAGAISHVQFDLINTIEADYILRFYKLNGTF